MTENVSINQEKSRVMALMHAAAVLLISYISFWGLSGICFGILELACKLNLVSYTNGFDCDWAQFFYQPTYVFELYQYWWNMVLMSERHLAMNLILMVPMLVPFVIIIAIISAFFSRNYSFKLWYVLNHHFAKDKDIKKMGIDDGKFLVLGKFDEKILSLNEPQSVLCLGEMGTGKTSSVAIPSVLRSDEACIVAVDMSGLLPKYTAGYRAGLGKIFYYNWDLLDDPEKKLFYPRWNPLDKANLPNDGDEKEAYLARIAGYLVDVDDAEKDNYWNILAHTIIEAFLGYWTAKVNQAKANDYFLGKIVAKQRLVKDEKDILLSYYLQMPVTEAKQAMDNLADETLDKDNYLPVGSWAGIDERWIGHEACFAAIVDWMIDNYMTAHDEHSKDWQGWLEGLLREAVLFGYGKSVIDGLKQFLQLSPKQRQIAFAWALKPFRIFTNQAIRERTNGNDFNIRDIHGIYDDETKRVKPITIYSLANTQASKILNQMFLNEMIYCNLHRQDTPMALPTILMLDDVGHNLRLKNLKDMLMNGQAKKISALLLCNSLSLVENKYSREELECLVMNTAYKIIKAPDNQKLSKQLDKLAALATKSVQIPQNRDGDWKQRGKYFANAYYFHRLALDFNVSKNLQVDTRNYQIVLAEGFYHRPVLAENIFFAEDDNLRKLAVWDTDYNLSESEINKKTPFMLETPKFAEVFDQKDLGVEDLVELDQYMNIVFDEVKLKIDADKKSAKARANEISSAKHIDKEHQKSQQSAKDWWLEEDAFKVYEKEDKNPFRIKK